MAPAAIRGQLLPPGLQPTARMRPSQMAERSPAAESPELRNRRATEPRIHQQDLFEKSDTVKIPARPEPARPSPLQKRPAARPEPTQLIPEKAIAPPPSRQPAAPARQAPRAPEAAP